MARGRMINNAITEDKRINDLSDDTSRLAFTWLITYADCEGRVPGDPALVRSKLFPRREDVTAAHMEGYIREWAQVGLVTRHEAEGDGWIAFTVDWLGGGETRSIWSNATWRNAVLGRDNYTCQGCGARGVRLYTHHIKPWILFPNARRDIDNGITLCRDCHRKMHGKGWKAAAQ